MSLSMADVWAAASEEERAAAYAQMTPEQVEALKWDWGFWGRPEQQLPSGSWFVWMIMTGRGWGKEVHNDTVIPTPSGWTTMGALATGDAVFDEAGRPCRVLEKFSPDEKEQYRVTFSDGSHIDAGASHQWVTWTHRDRKQYLRYGLKTEFPIDWPTWRGTLRSRWGDVGAFGAEIRTTRQIAETLTQGSRGDLNHCIPVAGALQLPEADLPTDPWLLGYWLGNGDIGDPSLTSGGYKNELDADYVAGRLKTLGLPHSRRDIEDERYSAFRLLNGCAWFPEIRRIPPAYLRASAAQRRALLHGLMDSDGYSGIDVPNVEFCSIHEGLARDVLELVRTLSERPVLFKGSATLNGNDYGDKWRIKWCPSVFNPFGLPRKAAKVRPVGAQGFRLRHRMIVSVDPIDPVPMSCITVDSPNSMYLAGEAMIPTHNTRTATETISRLLRGPSPLTAPPGAPRVMSFVADTGFDMRQYSIEGPSGFLNVGPPDHRPVYHPGSRTLDWPCGARALLFSAEDPEATRGASGSLFWWDELAKAPKASMGWSNLLFGMREGNPRGIVTTTPRPIHLIRQLIKSPSTHLTVGSTWENRANLPEAYYREVIEPLQGTRLGRQEINAEILDDIPGALWTRAMIDAARAKRDKVPDMMRVVVAVDPSGVRGPDDEGDSQGIIVAGRGMDGRGYVLADRSCKLSPSGWGNMAVRAYYEFKADRIIAERNFGGAMVEHVVRTIDQRVSYLEVVASRGKAQRAEPISALYERGMVSHLGNFVELEDQLCQMTSGGYCGKGSPDRLDAAVWALTELMIGESTYDATMSWVA